MISAAPSAMCRTFSTSSFIAASVAARTKNSACAKSGTTFGTSPPWVMIPWMRASAVMCWRKALMPVEDLDDRVQRVDAVEGIRRRVRRSPVKADLDQHAGQRLTAPLDRRTGRLGGPGVSAQRGVDAREDPGLGHDHLAADRFFRRRAKDVDPAPTSQMRQRRGEPQTGADPGDGDQVVTAAVTHSRQGVIFAEVGDARLTRARRAANAVGSPATPRSTVNPRSSRKSAQAALDRTSCNAISGLSWMNFDRAIRSSAASSMARTAAACAAVRSTSCIVAVNSCPPSSLSPFLECYRLRTGAIDTKHVSF